jgi:hypothetical protein
MEIIDLKETRKEQKEDYINILVGRKKIQWIAYNFVLSEHAEFRMVQRDTLTNRNLKNCIIDTVLAWKNTNGTISIALDLYNYIIVKIENDIPKIITFASTKEFDCTVVDKMFVEYKRFIRGDK